MQKLITQFLKREDGAVTVDWVVLTAGVVGLAVGAFLVIETETQTLSNNIAATVTDVDTTGAAGAAGVAGQ